MPRGTVVITLNYGYKIPWYSSFNCFTYIDQYYTNNEWL